MSWLCHNFRAPPRAQRCVDHTTLLLGRDSSEVWVRRSPRLHFFLSGVSTTSPKTREPRLLRSFVFRSSNHETTTKVRAKHAKHPCSRSRCTSTYVHGAYDSLGHRSFLLQATQCRLRFSKRTSEPALRTTTVQYCSFSIQMMSESVW